MRNLFPGLVLKNLNSVMLEACCKRLLLDVTYKLGVCRVNVFFFLDICVNSH